MDEIRLIIPCQLPSMNEIINACKGHWGSYRSIKSEYEGAVAAAARSNKVPEFESIELEIIYFREDKRTDPDNISAGKKVLLDGLVAAGVIQNDGWKQVKKFKETWKIDKGNPRTEVIIRGRLRGE